MKEKSPSILYVEDDITLSFVTQDNLKMKGYSIDFCENGEEAIKKFQKNNYDLCILDVMLPKMDGFSVAKKIRESNPHLPIIFLTAKSDIDDKIEGLKLGGDDYITKPFSIEELVLKIEVFLKRNRISYPEDAGPISISMGQYTIDMEKLTLSFENQAKQLTYKEAELLRLFHTNLGRILKREEILQRLWDDDGYFAGRSMDVFISRLRKYLKDDKNIKIENIHGVGFRLEIKKT